MCSPGTTQPALPQLSLNEWGVGGVTCIVLLMVLCLWEGGCLYYFCGQSVCSP